MKDIFILLISMVLFVACGLSKHSHEDDLFWIYVSSDDTESSHGGIGIYEWNPAKGKLVYAGEDSTMSSSSYLAIDHEHDRLYSINSTGISSFAINRSSGNLESINHKAVSSQGLCYIALAKNKKYLMVASYTSGEIITYSLGEDGAIGSEISNIHHEGSSITARQESAHPHMILPSPFGDLIFVTDLGTDRVYTFKVSEDGQLDIESELATDVPAGFGPRHMTFHPSKPIVYVLGELSAEIIGFNYDPNKGITTGINQVSTLPESFNDYNNSADIHMSNDGQYLFASNRGHNSIASFEVNRETGELIPKEIKSSQGDWPRAFEIDPTGSYLLIANKRSNNIAALPLDEVTGNLKEGTNYESVSLPQCIKFIPKSTID